MADLREDLVCNPPLEGPTLWLLGPKYDAVKPGIVDVNGLALVVVIRVGGWVVQRPTP